MKIVIQRVKKASVTINEEITASIEDGLLVLLGIKTTDNKESIAPLIKKLIHLRIFDQGEKNFDQSILERSKNILLVSQFTLYSNCSKGRRPDFQEAARSKEAEHLYEEFKIQIKQEGINLQTGVFGADMQVASVNDGPVTIIIEN